MIKIRLRQLLDSHGMTQAELADKTHIRPSTISALCNGAAISFKFSQLESICKVLDCDVKDILKVEK
ncbi:MAG: helix-turn-helix domain-containing protein [Oscillospiraceae bacterium]